MEDRDCRGETEKGAEMDREEWMEKGEGEGKLRVG